MFRLVVASLALVGASAFMGAPVGHRAAVKSSMSMSYEAELGAQKPLGFWVSNAGLLLALLAYGCG